MASYHKRVKDKGGFLDPSAKCPHLSSTILALGRAQTRAGISVVHLATYYIYYFINYLCMYRLVY